jgi:2-oxo-4-hydroxy-4-carboxy--5-ureidoimidazoline (OHCU) decarboxylase
MLELRIAVVALLVLPLGGCFSLVAQKEVPDWAMNAQVQSVDAPEAARKPKVAKRPTAAQRTASRQMVTGAVPSDTQPAGLDKSFGPEWQAQQQELDDRLRQQMNICRGC